jgi:extracellular elastinolytic metalloproteinase
MPFSAFRARFSVLLLVIVSLALPSYSQSDPLTTANSWLESNAGQFGLSAADISDRGVSDNYQNSLNGVTHIYYIQRYQGIEVFNAIFSLAVTPSGAVVAPQNRFVANLAQRVNTTAPLITSDTAVHSAATHLGMDSATAQAPPQLKFLASGKNVRLTWDLTIEQDSNRIWIMKVDAVTGAVLHQWNMMQNDSYKVYAWPAESPNHASPIQPADGRTIVTEAAADAVASRFGWHDTNGAAGADTTNTTGNNVNAQTDLPLVPGTTVTDNSFTSGVDVRPSDANRNFVYPADLTKNPDQYREAVVTNLFYWNNVIHDIMYKYGFNEDSGNFQRVNYTGAGRGNDPVNADAQDGSGTNNANFGTPADGSSPRMQMFIWIPSKGSEVVVNSPAGLGPYAASPATFGRQLDATGLTGDVVLVDDGVGVTWDFCEPMPIGSLQGKIALAERGTCNFTVKASNADQAGASGLIVVNNQGDNETVTMGSATPQTDPLLLVAAQMVGRRDGLQLKDNLPANVTMRNTGANIPRRDSDFDNGVIIHEYGHGISNRLTGGPSRVTCLTSSQQAGEGWSDWYALALTAREGDTATTPRTIAGYLVFEDDPATARGIRPFQYTTDMSVNPQTYGDLAKGTLTIPHGVGSVWATATWDMYWALTGGVPSLGLPALGFRQDLYNVTEPLAGNQIAIRLVTEGMRLQPCQPSFLEARDAILEADRINYGGAHACYIWWAFARRGMGVNAMDDRGPGGAEAADGLDVTEDFSMPQSCTGGACLVSPRFAGAHSVVSATDGSTKLTVRWDAAVPNCGTSVSYTVYRSTESNFVPGSGNQIASGVTGTTYTDSQVTSGVRYFYVVRATDSLGNTDANTKRRSGVPTGELSAGATFFDDAGDTRPVQFLPNAPVRSWVVRGAGGVLESKTYATNAAGNYPASVCMQLESDTIYLGADPDLQFFSSWQIEPAWDGGIVEVATEGGNFGDWTKLDTITYPGVMNGPEGDPACSNAGLRDGEFAFNGASPTFIPFIGSLGAYANQNVRLRFVFGSDSGTELGGWLIDNVSVDDVRASGPTTCFEDNSEHIAYSTGWHSVSDSNASGGSFSVYAGKKKDTGGMSLDFDVSQGPATLIYSYAKSTKGGTADVYVDGVFKATIDYKSGNGPKTQAPTFGFSFRVEGLSTGAHKFELRNVTAAAFVDAICINNAHSSSFPVSVPGVTTVALTDVAAGLEFLQNLTLPSGTTDLSVVAESDPELPIQLVVLDALGGVVGTADNSTGYAIVEAPASAGAYVVKVVNLGTGPVRVWTASTPLVQK